MGEDAFNRIVSGKKKIEIRLFDEKRKRIKIGDKIIFFKLPEKKERVLTEVIGLYRFGSFEALFRKFDNSCFGHPESMTAEEKIQGMYEHYSKEDESNLGVLAIHIKLI